MKKIILGILAIGSLSFAQGNYEVYKNDDYQISMEQINKLNPEIEKAISKFYTFENMKNMFEKELGELSRNEKELNLKMFGETYKYFSYKIKKVSYVSENNVKILVEIKYPDMDEKNLLKDLDEVFKAKTGQNYYDYTHKAVLQEKKITDAYEKVLYDCEFEAYKKMLSKLTANDYQMEEIELQGIKENGEWKIGFFN